MAWTQLCNSCVTSFNDMSDARLNMKSSGQVHRRSVQNQIQRMTRTKRRKRETDASIFLHTDDLAEVEMYRKAITRSRLTTTLSAPLNISLIIAEFAAGRMVQCAAENCDVTTTLLRGHSKMCRAFCRSCWLWRCAHHSERGECEHGGHIQSDHAWRVHCSCCLAIGDCDRCGARVCEGCSEWTSDVSKRALRCHEKQKGLRPGIVTFCPTSPRSPQRKHKRCKRMICYHCAHVREVIYGYRCDGCLDPLKRMRDLMDRIRVIDEVYDDTLTDMLTAANAALERHQRLLKVINGIEERSNKM